MERALRNLLPGGTFGKVDAVHSRRMAAIGAKDTTPEMTVRRLMHSLGYRYRLHVRTLPGTPDLVFPSRRKIIDVKGCFWHLHGCPHSHVPKARYEFWVAKLRRNKQRDQQTSRALRRLGWNVLTIWECQTRDLARLKKRIDRFFASD
jgi:DNA mismatch endonuclease (patch repair protein)